ncbi:MAG: hypothetical protein E7571_08875 [Ruminococcaceae bacterium]|nr:hypothetical protein [Oscillospiraceae bacterium]
MVIRYDFEYLIHLIYCAIHDLQPEEKPEQISFENVFLLGKEHEVGNIAFLSVEKLENKPDAELYNEWQVFYYHSVQRDARQLAQYSDLCNLLSENKIRWTEAQGTVTKTYYPTHDSRMMSDIDLIVDVSSLGKIESLMVQRGYEVKKIHENELNVYPENETEIEFHTEYFSEFYKGSLLRYSGAINSPFDHAVQSEENEYKYVQSDTYYYLYSLLHTIKHFEYAGCGIRRILDLYFVEKALGDKVDRKVINNALEQYGFAENANKLFKVERYWFEGEKPDSDLIETIIDILQSGNHGNSDIKLRNSLRRDADDGMAKAKLRRVKNFLFPSLEELYEGHPDYKEKGYSLFRCRLYRALSHLNPKQILKMFRFFNRIKKSN